MKKKILFGLSGALLITTALAGCSGSKGEVAEPGSAAKPTTIKVQGWYTEAQGNWKATVEAYNKLHPEVKVVYESMSENGDSKEGMKKLDLLAASGDEMDVIMYPSAPDFAQRAGAGVLEPLDEYLKKDGIVVKDEYQIDPVLDGKYYVLPGKLVQWFVMMNKDKLDEANLPVPKEWTWNDYAEYAKKLTKGEGPSKVYGSYFHTWKDYSLLALNNDPQNPYVVKADGSQNIDNQKTRYSLDLRFQMENKDNSSVPYYQVISQKMNVRDVFYAGKAAMALTGNWMVSELPLNGKFKTAFAPYPKYDAKDENGYTDTGADYIGVAASSKHKKEAYEFVKWYSTEGIIKQGMFFSPWKKADINTNLEAILKNGKPDLIALMDKESLLHTLKIGKNPKLVIPPTYGQQQEKEFLSQVERFLTNSQDLETTIQNSVSKMEQIKKSNK